MGKLLEQAISEASKLPESEQEAIGAWLLAELESERRWSELFGRSGSVPDRMADEALNEHEQGLTAPLDPAVCEFARDPGISEVAGRAAGGCSPSSALGIPAVS